MDTLLSDLRHAVRGLARSPSYTVAAVLSLSLGIGANVGVFSVTNALLLRPLPVPAGERLVRIGWTAEGRPGGRFSLPEIRDLAATEALEEVAAHQTNLVIVSDGRGEPVEVMGEVVTDGYFRTLGLAASVGRLFATDAGAALEDERSVVLGHDLWRRQLGSDAGVVGRTVRINGVPLTVVGVAPPGFRGVLGGLDVSVWLPLSLHAEVWRDVAGPVEARDSRFLMTFGRLPSAVGKDAARALLQGTVDAWPELRESGDSEAARREIVLEDARGVPAFLAGLVRGFLLLLSAAVALVLLVASANVANLQLARAWSRKREIAVRRAVGGSAARIMQKLMTESLVLALAGAVGGVVVGLGITMAVPRLIPPVGIPVALDLAIDGRVLAFSLALAAGVALLTGLTPGAFAARRSLADLLREEGAGTGRTGIARRVLIAGQVAVATVLLAGAGLTVRSLQGARGMDPGFDVSGGWILQAEAGLFGDSARARRFWGELTERARALPGVRSAALALMVPMGDRGDRMGVAPDGWEGDPARPPMLAYNLVGPDYFETLGIRLLAGRAFTPADEAGAPPVAVVSEAMARAFWPEGSPVGRTLRVWGRDGRELRVEVVGVAGNITYAAPGRPPEPFVYLPLAQTFRPDLHLHFRSPQEGSATANEVARVARGLEPELPFRVRSLSEASSFVLVPVRILRWVLGAAGVAALALAVAGLFGVVSYNVSRRAREMGIRIALGATPGRIAASVTGESLLLALGGALLGLPLAILAGTVLRSFLFGVSPADPWTLGAVAGALACVAATAAWLPARRASRVDPSGVLRQE